MIEAIVHDVVARTAINQPDSNIGAIRIILLKERDGSRILPIWVGPWEGDVIAIQLEQIKSARPMTFDLANQLLALSAARIEKIAVTELRDNTYISTMWLKVDGKEHQIDARPSDAIALALKANATIFVAPELLSENDSITSDNAIDQLNDQFAKLAIEGKVDAEPVPMEFKSVREIIRAQVEKSKPASSTQAPRA